MSQKPRKAGRGRRLLNALLTAVLALLVLVLLAMFLVNQRPGFFQAAESRDRQKLLDDAVSFSRRVEEFISDVWSERATPIEIADDEVNGYLAAVNDPEIWKQIPLKFESWRKTFTSAWLRNIQVDFADGRVTVSGEVTWHDVDVVLSVIGRPETDVEGQARLRVTGIRAGRLPLPKFLFHDFLKDVDNRPLPAKISHWRLKSVEILDGKAILHGETAGHE